MVWLLPTTSKTAKSKFKRERKKQKNKQKGKKDKLIEQKLTNKIHENAKEGCAARDWIKENTSQRD